MDRKGKSGRGSWGNQVQNKRLQHIFNLVHYILMKPSGNVVGIKRVKTDV